MAPKMSLSQAKKLTHAFVKDELMLKATDGMKTASRVPRKEPLLISVEKPFKEDSVSPSKAIKAEMDKMKRVEEKMLARAAVTIPADEFISKVTSAIHRVITAMGKEVEQKEINCMKRYAEKMVEMAALKGRDLTMVSWNQELIDIIHKLEEIKAEDGSASNSKEREDLKKICVMIYNHIEAHLEVVMEKLEAV